MYYISEHSSFYENEVYGTLIGIHENYLYSANSFDEELQIYRRKVMETREWELVWSVEISSKSYCPCRNTVSAAYGIIGDELYIAAFGKKPNDYTIRFHLSSFNLLTGNVIDYKTDNNTLADFCYTLCNQCCLSSITALNPENSFEIAIVPWAPEPETRISTTTGTHVDYVQTKLRIDPENKICTYLQSTGFCIIEQMPFYPGQQEQQQQCIMNSSNIGVLEFGKILYFRGNDLYLGQSHPSETRLEIVEDSDLHECLYAGFHLTSTGLQCVAFEKAGNKRQQICTIYNLFIDEEKHSAKFTKIATLPSFLLPSDPRLSKFVMDSRMLIWSYHGQTFAHIFGMLSLSEAAYISASNSYSPLFQEYQKLSEMQERDYDGIFNEAQNLGLTQNDIKSMFGLPESFEFSCY